MAKISRGSNIGPIVFFILAGIILVLYCLVFDTGYTFKDSSNKTTESVGGHKK